MHVIKQRLPTDVFHLNTSVLSSRWHSVTSDRPFYNLFYPPLTHGTFGSSNPRSHMKLIGNVSMCVVMTALLLPSVTVSLAGFGSGGIVVGSKVTMWQLAIGGVEAGSLFWKGAVTVAGAAASWRGSKQFGRLQRASRRKYRTFTK